MNIADLFKDKKGIIFGVPGAFTPGCSKTHLPGYVDDFDKLKVSHLKFTSNAANFDLKISHASILQGMTDLTRS